MNIFLECPNPKCEEKRIPATAKGALKNKRCPYCDTELPLTGDEAQALLLAKLLAVRNGEAVDAKFIQSILNDFYIKTLELELPKIIVEETTEERIKRKAMQKLDEPVATVQQEPQVIAAKLDPETEKTADTNAKVIQDAFDEQLAQIDAGKDLEDDGFSMRVQASASKNNMGGSTEVRKLPKVVKSTQTAAPMERTVLLGGNDGE